MFNKANYKIDVFQIIKESVELVEQYMNAQDGKAKEEAVIEFVCDVLKELQIKIPDIVIKGVITAVVKLYNKIGKFKHKKDNDD